MAWARFTAVTPECVRLEFVPDAEPRFLDGPTLLALARGSRTAAPPAGPEDYGPPHMIVGPPAPGETVPERTFECGRLVVRYRPDGSAFHAGNLRIDIRPGPGWDGAVWTPDLPARNNLGGPLRTLDGVRGTVPLPDGLLSTDGWYLLDDSAGHVLVDGWPRPRAHVTPGATDWYLLGYGRDYKAALRALAAIGGPAAMPRRALLGSWYSRYWPYTAAELERIAAEYDERGYPLDVMVLDMDWHRAGWTGWSWNRELIPDPPALLRSLHGRGLAVTLNLHPADGVGPHEDRYADFMRALGRDPAEGGTLPFDAGDRAYTAALFERVLRPLEEDGVDFWWLDWQQDEFARSIPDLPNIAWLNELFHGWSTRGGGRGAIFSRWGGFGSHRHAVHFSGDTHSGWRSLAFLVPFTAASGNAGCFFWTHDIGGHFGARDEEAAARWVQFGALSAALRLHSARSVRLDRRPWTHEPAYESAMQAAFALRSRLMPYIYTQARRCHTHALPLIRPMYLEYPHEAAAYRSPQQYLLGDPLLAAPIVTPGVGPRRVAVQEVWFPPLRGAPGAGGGVAGSGLWYDWSTGEPYVAGTEAVVAAEIDEVPLYVPGGVPIPAQPFTRRMGSAPLDHLVVRLFPGEAGFTGRAAVYEDDGLTDAHARGEHATTPLTAIWGEDSVRIEVGPGVGSFSGQPAERRTSIELAGVAAVRSATVNGGPADAPIAPGSHIAVIDCGAGAPGRRSLIEIAFDRADARALAEAARRRRLAGALGEPVDDPSLAAALRRLMHAGGASLGFDTILAIAAGIAVRVDDPCGGPHARPRLYDTFGLMDGGRASLTLATKLGREPESAEPDRELTVAPGGAVPIDDVGGDLPDPPPGLRASRLARIAFTSGGEPASFTSILRTKLGPLRAWHVAGPFPFEWARPIDDQRHGPEADGGAPVVDPGAVYTGTGGAGVRWVRAAASRHWAVSIGATLGEGAGGLAYAAARVRSPCDQDVVLQLDSGDRLEAWVNAARVFSMDTGETLDAASGLAYATLRCGWNTIVVKVSQGGGWWGRWEGWGFTAAIDGRAAVEESWELA